MFGRIKSRTYLLFAGLDLLWIPIVYFFYLETKDRSLESIEAMFSSSSSPFYLAMEKSYLSKGDVLIQQGGKEAVERKLTAVSIGSEKLTNGEVRTFCWGLRMPSTYVHIYEP
jgi:Sugar (and other) transporter